MTAIPCFPREPNVLPVRTQLDPMTPVRFVGFDGEFYSVQPIHFTKPNNTYRRSTSFVEVTYKLDGGEVLVHKNFLKFFIRYKAGG